MSKNGITEKASKEPERNEVLSLSSKALIKLCLIFLAFYVSRTNEQSFLLKVACVGFFGTCRKEFQPVQTASTPKASLMSLLCGYLRVRAGKLRTRGSDLALSYSLVQLITTPLPQNLLLLQPSLPLLLGSASSQRPQPKPLNPPP